MINQIEEALSHQGREAGNPSPISTSACNHTHKSSSSSCPSPQLHLLEPETTDQGSSSPFSSLSHRISRRRRIIISLGTSLPFSGVFFCRNTPKDVLITPPLSFTWCCSHKLGVKSKRERESPARFLGIVFIPFPSKPLLRWTNRQFAHSRDVFRLHFYCFCCWTTTLNK